MAQQMNPLCDHISWLCVDCPVVIRTVSINENILRLAQPALRLKEIAIAMIITAADNKALNWLGRI